MGFLIVNYTMEFSYIVDLYHITPSFYSESPGSIHVELAP